MTAIARIIAVAGVLAASGCGPRERLNGTYQGVRPFTVPKGGDPFVARQLATVRLTVKPDGTADLSDGGVPLGGRIEYGGDGASFVPLTVAGVSVDRQKPELAEAYQAKLQPNPDGSWVYKGALVLKKVAAP